MSLTATLLVLAWVAIIILGFAVAGVLRQVQALAAGPIQSSQIGPRLGLAAPRLGELDLTRADDDVVLMFVSSDCATCTRILSAVNAWPKEMMPTRLMLVSKEPLKGDQRLPSNTSVHVDEAGSLFRDYGIRATPFMVRLKRGVVIQAERVGSPALAEHFVLQARQEVA